MRIGQPRPPAPASRSEPVRGPAQAPASGPRAVADSASIFGIPEAELTPKVRDALMRLMAEVDRLRQESERHRARIAYLEQLADQDTLTPIVNRRAFVRELSRAMSYGERYNTESSVIYFDLNDLKEINDTWGHPAGDAALVKVASTLRANVRESDTVGRLGGDEFGVILTHAGHEAASEKAEALAAAIAADPLVWEGQEIALHLAFGVYSFSGGDAGDALAAADRAMYEHKRGDEGEGGEGSGGNWDSDDGS